MPRCWFARAAAAVVAGALVVACSGDRRREAPADTLPPGPWLDAATLGGAVFVPDSAPDAIDRTLDELVAENVSAVVGHSPVSEHYRTDAELDVELQLVRQVAERAHRRGLRLLWAMPTLSQRGGEESPAVAREHPEWVQIAPDVGADDTDGVLLCPVGPAREWLLARVRKLARSGVDALLLEAPELAPLRGEAQLGCPEYRAAFRAETGFDVPPRVPCDDPDKSPPAACEAVWRDPAWRAFLRHRHTTLAELEAAIASAARESAPDVLTVIRERAFDTNDATDLGNDASFAREVEGLHRLWDVPVPSAVEGMRRASADDWIQRIAMLEYARGVDRGRTLLASSTGATEWDARLAIATALATQASPWELRANIPHASVSRDLRTDVFAWAKEHLPVLQAARTAARVVILQSSSSRDLLDFGYGSGKFTTFLAPATGAGGPSVGPDASWFAEGAPDGTGALETVGELRGMVKALVHLHVPFDIAPAESVTAESLSRYRLVIAPDVVAISDRSALAIRDLVERGGTVLSTGLGTWRLDEVGRERPELAVGDMFGTRKIDPLVPDTASARASAMHVEALVGRRYLRYGDELALDLVRSAVERAGAAPIATNAPREVWFDLLERDDEVLLDVVNLSGVSTGASSPVTMHIELEVPRTVSAIAVASPDPGAEEGASAFVSPEEGLVSFDLRVAEYSLVRLRLGTEGAARAPRSAGPPAIALLRESSGLAGHSIGVHGSGFGSVEGTVTWGDQRCTVTGWRPDAISCWLPHAAAPGTADVVVHASGASSNASPFTVVGPALVPSTAMKQAFDFIKTKMRSSFGGVFTNFKDRVDDATSNEVYPYGHHQTAEHLGLFLWTAAALEDHAAFEDAYAFLTRRMLSPRTDVVNWAIDKTTGTPMLQSDAPGAPLLSSNAPLDDFRVVNGLVAGWEQWKDPRYYWTALRIGNALFETSTTAAMRLPEYPEGLVAYAYNWAESAGAGETDLEVIPIDYADLWTMTWLSERDRRWAPVIDANARLMERASLPAGHFWNSYLTETMTLSGDFEYRDTIAGQKIKAIQSLWTAIHLARIGRIGAARRALDFYEKIYAERGRIAEYLNADGSECTEPDLASTLHQGEARIYAQLVRLAYYLGDTTFGDQVIAQKILVDQVTEPASALFGSIGKSSTDADDAEAWNTLEALLALALQGGSPVVGHIYR